MILIITHDKDAHGQHLLSLIQKRGEKVQELNFANFPRNMELSFRFDIAQSKLSLPGLSLDLKDVKSVFNRRQSTPQVICSNFGIKEHVISESKQFLDSLVHFLPCFWISHPDAVKIASRKAYQLQLAAKLGFNIPPTLISNSPEEVRKFVQDLGMEAEIAVKNLFSAGIDLGEEKLGFFTKRLEPNDILSRSEKARNCPLIYQKYVEKELELRVTVVGKKIFACAMETQVSAKTKVDWRHYDLENTPHYPIDLPSDIEEKCFSLLRNLNLVFGCIDMILTPAGEYVFLEINPNGQWLWIEQRSGIPISDAIVNLLISAGSNS